MKALTNPLSIATFNRIANSARQAHTPRPKYDSRTADKFVVRGYVELFKELAAIGGHQGRSMNSEAIAGTLDALAGRVRSEAILRVLKSYLDEGWPTVCWPRYPTSSCPSARPQASRYSASRPQSSIRFVMEWPRPLGGNGDDFDSPSMNSWMVSALVSWVNMQRKHYALLNAAIVLDQSRAAIGSNT